jgi:hypothetical protein
MMDIARILTLLFAFMAVGVIVFVGFYLAVEWASRTLL